MGFEGFGLVGVGFLWSRCWGVEKAHFVLVVQVGRLWGRRIDCILEAR